MRPVAPDCAHHQSSAFACKGGERTLLGKKVVSGNAHSLKDEGITGMCSPARPMRSGATAILIAVDGSVGGAFAITDPVKRRTPDALAALGADSIPVVMLTGDNRTAAQQHGIDWRCSGTALLLPAGASFPIFVHDHGGCDRFRRRVTATP